MRHGGAPSTPEFEEPSEVIKKYLLADANNLNQSVDAPDRYVARGLYVVDILAQLESDPNIAAKSLDNEAFATELNARYNDGLARALKTNGGPAAPAINMNYSSWMAYLHARLYPGIVAEEKPRSHFELMLALHEGRAWYKPKER